MAHMIPIGLAVAGTALSAGGSIIGANSEAKEMRREAAQLEANAGLERASSQRAAMDERRQAKLAQSRGLAVAGKSGAGIDDPTVVNLMAGIEGEGEYRALSALYEGEESARGMEADAAARRRGAKSTKTAGLIKAGSTILQGGSSMYDRFG
jgi:hypothetical protein